MFLGLVSHLSGNTLDLEGITRSFDYFTDNFTAWSLDRLTGASLLRKLLEFSLGDIRMACVGDGAVRSNILAELMEGHLSPVRMLEVTESFMAGNSGRHDFF